MTFVLLALQADVSELERRLNEALDQYVFSSDELGPLRQAVAALASNDSWAGAQSVLRILSTVATQAAENMTTRKALRLDLRKLASAKPPKAESEARKIDILRRRQELLDLRQRRLDGARLEVLTGLAGFRSEGALAAFVRAYPDLADPDARRIISSVVSESISRKRDRWLAVLRAADDRNLAKGK